MISRTNVLVTSLICSSLGLFNMGINNSAYANPQIMKEEQQSKQKQADKPVKGINKVDDGNTIAEIYTQQKQIKGKIIRVRGQVTKFNANIMGKNWLHIKDSSTSDDLTVTTNSRVAIDDIVIIEGKLELNKDFGYGYIYPIILEDATITKE